MPASPCPVLSASGRRTVVRVLTGTLALLLSAGVASAASLDGATGQDGRSPALVALASAAAPAAAAASPAAAPAVAAAVEVPRTRSARRTAHAAARRATRPRTVRSTARRAPRVTARGETLEQAVARIPGYSPGAAQWVVSGAYGSWGTADWYRGVVYVSPSVPGTRMYDVAVHEWSHLLSVRPYGGDVAAATDAMNQWFGGSGLTGAERAADCMALLQGARWTHYTRCSDGRWRDGARSLLAGRRL